MKGRSCRTSFGVEGTFARSLPSLHARLAVKQRRVLTCAVECWYTNIFDQVNFYRMVKYLVYF